MHFSVMVPVKVPVITNEAIERAQAANVYLEAMAQAQENAPSEDKDALFDSVILKCNMQHARSVATPFAAAVDDAVAEAMEPYSQDTDNPEYLEFEDETEDLKHRYETGTTKAILYNGKYYGRHHFKNFRECSDGVIREITPDGKEFLSPKARQMTIVTVTFAELYGTFRKFANDNSTYHKEKKAWGYYSNPNCFWDWYSIGGRWDYGLLVKEDCTDIVGGVPGVGSDGQMPPAPEGYKWTSAARKKDICIDKMTEWSIQVTRETYAKYLGMWNGEIPLEQYMDKKADGIYRYGHCIFDPNKSIDDVLATHDFKPETALSRIFHGYLDTLNWEPGDFGYYECDSTDDWDSQFADFLADLDDDHVIVTVDCHM